jgi:hypothetical protein
MVRGDASMGSGTNNTARYLGSGLGIAIVTSTVEPTSASTLLHSWETPIVLGSVVSVLIGIAIPSIFAPPPVPPRRRPRP